EEVSFYVLPRVARGSPGTICRSRRLEEGGVASPEKYPADHALRRLRTRRRGIFLSRWPDGHFPGGRERVGEPLLPNLHPGVGDWEVPPGFDGPGKDDLLVLPSRRQE